MDRLAVGSRDPGRRSRVGEDELNGLSRVRLADAGLLHRAELNGPYVSDLPAGLFHGQRTCVERCDHSGDLLVGAIGPGDDLDRRLLLDGHAERDGLRDALLRVGRRDDLRARGVKRGTVRRIEDAGARHGLGGAVCIVREDLQPFEVERLALPVGHLCRIGLDAQVRQDHAGGDVDGQSRLFLDASLGVLQLDHGLALVVQGRPVRGRCDHAARHVGLLAAVIGCRDHHAREVKLLARLVGRLRVCRDIDPLQHAGDDRDRDVRGLRHLPGGVCRHDLRQLGRQYGLVRRAEGAAVRHVLQDLVGVGCLHKQAGEIQLVALVVGDLVRLGDNIQGREGVHHDRLQRVPGDVVVRVGDGHVLKCGVEQLSVVERRGLVVLG